MTLVSSVSSRPLDFGGGGISNLGGAERHLHLNTTLLSAEFCFGGEFEIFWGENFPPKPSGWNTACVSETFTFRCMNSWYSIILIIIDMQRCAFDTYYLLRGQILKFTTLGQSSQLLLLIIQTPSHLYSFLHVSAIPWAWHHAWACQVTDSFNIII